MHKSTWIDLCLNKGFTVYMESRPSNCSGTHIALEEEKETTTISIPQQSRRVGVRSEHKCCKNTK